MSSPSPMDLSNQETGQKASEILPMDMWFEILLKLSVRSLLTLKCVSKSFLSLIQSQNFARQHFISYEQSDTHLMLLEMPFKYGSYDPFGIGKLMVRPVNALSEHDHPPIHQSKEFELPVYWGGCCSVVDYVDGLLVTCGYNLAPGNTLTLRDITLTNPSIRKDLKIPLPPRSELLNHHFGFGLDPLSGDYKIVAILFDDNQSKTYVEVYSLRIGCWRTIGVDLIPHSRGFTWGKYANGVVHFRTGEHHPGIDGYRSVASFDLGTELFSYTNFPDDEEEDLNNSEFDLLFGDSSGWFPGLLNGSFVLFYINDRHIVIWKMKDNSWSKEYVIECEKRLFGALWDFWSRITNMEFMEKSGELLVNVLMEGVMLYNTKTTQIKFPYGGTLYASVYVESLLWPEMNGDFFLSA